MTVTKPRARHTYEDYLALPEDMARRYELLQGELQMVPQPTTRHQKVQMNLAAILHTCARTHALGDVFVTPTGVILGTGDAREVVEPDVLFVAQARRDIIKPHAIEGAPDLVVEILSPGTANRDRGYKRALYARYGVGEYWLVDTDAGTIEVHGGIAPPRICTRRDSLQTPLLPGLTLALEDVFAD
jgi:Uma2 family endonuclease